ncbi:glutamine amidotransferase [Granulicella cerasi]|uniref:Glutamine amidotransferase n=1 Tax=Granulicella cerasi TaxID=741063 RepID=A0ABW1Z9Y3_9BACT|nr:glutamine amidotransferase [Granulicella cerasi]
MKSAVAIRHVHFEGLGSLESVLSAQGFHISYFDIGVSDLTRIDPLRPDLLIVLGAPVGVYEDEHYPFLAVERNLLAKRLDAKLPTLGICLGAQQIAYTLGADVAPTSHKEIGFATIDLTDEGRHSPLRHLDGVKVLHWHGDGFAIPAGASRLASTSLCANQAFAIDEYVLALQFHPEIDNVAGMEQWLIGHAAELGEAKIDPRTIRNDAAACVAPLRNAAQRLFSEWLMQL